MKLDRLISIIMLLLEQKIISAAKLAKIFDVSTRTIYRDIDAIAQAGIPIVTYPGQNGGIGIMEQYKVDKRLFTVSDITSLLIGLEGVRPALSESETAHALAKVRGMIPPEQLTEIEHQTNQIAIDLTPWTKDLYIEKKLSVLKNALSYHKTINFDYKNASGSTSNREVEPCRLLHKGNNWYLQGYCLLRNEFRTFRLQRIEDLRLTENDFSPREFDPSVFDISYAFYTPMVQVDIRFNEAMRKGIIEFYGEEAITSHHDGVYTAKIIIFDNEQGYNTLLIYADQCEVLAPAHIRNYIHQKACEIANLHKQ